MLTINNILKEIKDVPVNRLEELYQFVHSLKPMAKKTNSSKKKILSFSGIFADMDEKNYTDFANHTKTIRANLFDRNVEL